MTRRSLLALLVAALALAGLCGPAGCFPSAPDGFELPRCCAERAAGTEPACCCGADDQRPPAEAPATTTGPESRAPVADLAGLTVHSADGSADGYAASVSSSLAAPACAPLHLVNCAFRC